MGFKTYLLYVFVVFMRPFEQFAPELMELRPVLILWVLTFVFTLRDASQIQWGAAERQHHWLLGGMAMAVLLSTAFNGGFAALGNGVGEFSTPAMLFVLTCMNVVSLERYRKLALLFLFCLVALCLESLYAYHTGWQAGEMVIRQLASENAIVPADLPLAPADDVSGTLVWRIRSVGFLSDPNDFAQTIIVVVPWLLMVGNWSKPLWRRVWLLLPIFACLAYTLTLTHSRGGLLGSVAALVFLFKGYVSRGNFIKLMIVAAVCGVVVLGGRGGGGDGRAMSTKEESANERINAWSDGILMLKSNPVVGVGYGNFTEHHKRTAHNSFVLCFSETGLLGYFLWLGLIVLSMKSLNRVISCTQPKSEAWLYATLLRASLVGFLVCAWFLSRTFVATLYILMGMSVCLLYIVRKSPATHASEASQARLLEPVLWRWTTLQFVVLTLVMVSMFVRSATM